MPRMDLTDAEAQFIVEQRRQRALEEAAKWTPKQACEYSGAEKMEWFDTAHATALENFEDARRNGETDDQAKQCAFEAVMELLGDDVWNRYDPLIRR